jgi:hypothetical protein
MAAGIRVSIPKNAVRFTREGRRRNPREVRKKKIKEKRKSIRKKERKKERIYLVKENASSLELLLEFQQLGCSLKNIV